MRLDRLISYPIAVAGCVCALACASDGPQTAANEAPTVAYSCTATFYDSQGGSEVGERSYDYSELPADRDPVKTCLQQSANQPLPGSMAFACECAAR